MGDDSLILWLSPELALGYFIAVSVGMLGAIQAMAAASAREDLRWLPRRAALPLGLLIALAALLLFYRTFYALIFVPGPAGLELMLLFGAGTALALWLTRLLARSVKRGRQG